MKPRRVQTGLRLDETTLQKITYIARQESRSLNAQIEHAVKKLIAEYETSHGVVQVTQED